jgi:hypothetical protein
MRRFSLLLLLVCVFLAGVFVGLWSAWKQNPSGRDLKYALQDNNLASLLVGAGDSVSVVTAGSAKAPKLDFFAGNPCTSNSTPDKCEINGSAAAGTYPFKCLSDNGYGCTDPAIQQGFLGFAKTSLLHLAGVQVPTPEVTEPAKAPGGPAATSSYTAYLSCATNNGTKTTVLFDSGGNGITSITATVGESVFWSSQPSFTLDSSKFPAGLCSNGNPTDGGGTKQAECDVNMSGQNAGYVVQQENCGPSGPLTLITK